MIQALLHHLIDYAGLFPPAALDMDDAVREYARQRRSEDAWILGRFVVPIGRLGDLAAAADGHVKDGPWPLSVLASSDDDRTRIDAFQDVHAGRLAVEAVETKASSAEEVTEKARFFSGLEVYVEIPHEEDPEPLLRAIVHGGVRGKIRTGGVTADAFPSSAEVARFICAAARTGAAWKATAGLHHALRGEYRLTYEPESPLGTMHGFLNVFLAAALARQGLGEVDVEAVLEECDASAFTQDAGGVAWRGHRLSGESLAATREGFATSYGSCSFHEPTEELRGLSLL